MLVTCWHEDKVAWAREVADLCWQWLLQCVLGRKYGVAPWSCCPALGCAALPPALYTRVRNYHCKYGILSVIQHADSLLFRSINQHKLADYELVFA